MKGDISADFHAPAKRFTGVRAQAGRVLTDADFNAAFDVLDDKIEALVRTLICASGSPDGGLQILSAKPVTLTLPDATTIKSYDVEVAPGTFLLGGRATVINAPIDLLGQMDWLSMPLNPSNLPPEPEAGRTDLIYLEQVEGPVFMVEDRELAERALGSADTTTRLRPRTQLKILEDVPPDCAGAGELLARSLALGGQELSEDGTELLSAARLGIAFVTDGPSLDPCAPASLAGYLGAENHTLRIMLTAPDRFVWAYDHGTPLFRIEVDAAAQEIQFLTEPRDPELYPLPGQIIEILPWDALLPNREKLAAPLGFLAKLTGNFNPPTNRIGYDGTMPAFWQTWLDGLDASILGRDDDPPRFFYARLWQAPVSGGGLDQAIGSNIVLPDTGVALYFTGKGVPGDYWTASLRPDVPELIQPWNLMIDPAAGEVPAAPPIGPRRFHSVIGLVSWPDPLGDPVVPEIHDCRNRFRRLCRIRSCCTYQVGNGQSSFGDFQTIQEAIDALPPEGGELCLLPGTHRGRIDLRGRVDIKMSGCGKRTRIEIDTAPNAPGQPGVRLDRSRGIAFLDFEIVGAGGPVFGARDPCEDIRFERLRIGAVDSAAIAFARAELVVIANCIIRAAPLREALTNATLATLLPLIYLAGEDLLIERNRIIALSLERGAQNRTALGGIQIGGGSEDVRIIDNRIIGGNGHGITLGSVIVGDGKPTGDIVITFPGWIIVDDDGCLKFVPGGTIVIPGRDGAQVRSSGPVRRLRIKGNLIEDHGGCGITVAYWFIAGAQTPTDALDDIEIEEAKIDDNQILRCMKIGLASALSVEAAFASGYGGIALASTADLLVDDNEIRFCGITTRSPICGVYIRFAERLRITRNRISDNGRPANLADPLLIGNIGGIVVSHADGVEPYADRLVREVPAAIITNNEVVSPEGRALELLGSGAMMVDDNSLTSHGNNSLLILLQLLSGQLTTVAPTGGTLVQGSAQASLRAAMAMMGGAAVLIFNSGRNSNLSSFGISATSFNMASSNAGSTTKGAAATVPIRSGPGGLVAFNDNIVAFDARSNAMTVALCSVAIVSLDDVGMHDNICTVDLTADLCLINALVVGFASCRVIGNRFRETPLVAARGLGAVTLSAATFGLLNATEVNQGDHCFLIKGTKRPRVQLIQTGALPQAILDTNRHTIGDDNCAQFDRMSSPQR